MIKKNNFSLYENFFKISKLPSEDEAFIDHYKKYSNVMNELTQSDSQKEKFYNQIVNYNFSKKEISSKEIIETITFPRDGNVIKNEEICLVFINKVQNISENLKIKDYHLKKMAFKTEMSQMVSFDFEKLKKIKSELKDLSLQENPYFLEAVQNFSGAIDKASFPVINILLSFSDVSELLTNMSMSQKISFVIGFKVFSKVYHSFLEPGSFMTYLKAVKDTLSGPELPLSHKVYILVLKPITPFIMPLIFAGIGSLITNNYKLPAPVLEVAVKAVGDVEKFIPNNSVREFFTGFNTLWQGYFFAIGRTIGNARDSFFQGLVGNYKEILKNILQKTIEYSEEKK